MKKNWISKMTWTIIGTVLSITVMAQKKPVELLRYGVKAGVQLSTIPKGESDAFSSLKINPC